MDLKVSKLRREASEFRKSSPRVSERFLALIELAKRGESRGRIVSLDYERVAAKFGISSRTLFRWKKGYKESNAKGVVPKAAPGRQAKPIRGYIAKKIKQMRRDYTWGAEVISAHLKYSYSIDIKKGRIYRFLKRQGLILGKRRYRKGTKHIRVVKVADPGAHTQTDVKHLPRILQDETKCYVYNFVDHASKWEFKRVYDSYGPSETRDFIERLLKKVPFSISRLQSDNGVEFTNKYISLVDKPKKHALDKICKKNNIRHVLIPPGEKELQGLVERSHRMYDEELYHRIRPRDVKHFNEMLSQHSEWKNSKRRRKILEWKTPLEWLAEYNSGKNKNQEKPQCADETSNLIKRAA